MPSDRNLVEWARLLGLCEEIDAAFGYAADVVSLKETRVQLLLKIFEKRLQTWNQDLEPSLKTGIFRGSSASMD